MKDYNAMARSVLARRDAYRKTRRKRLLWLGRGAAALCLCLALTLGGPQRPEVQAPVAELQGKEDLSAAVGTEPAICPAQDEPITDVPVVENPGSVGELLPFEAIWGGSYTDGAGRMVIWLTENTAENQEEVFARNPGLDRSTTIFLQADFSLDDLTRLLANISEGMRAGQLPFVPSACVREDINRVEVSLTDRSEENISAVLAYDSLGGAIEFRYCEGIAVEDILVRIEK